MWNWREEKKVAEKELDQRRAASSEDRDAATSVIFAESDFTRLTTCGKDQFLNPQVIIINSCPNNTALLRNLFIFICISMSNHIICKKSIKEDNSMYCAPLVVY